MMDRLTLLKAQAYDLRKAWDKLENQIDGEQMARAIARKLQQEQQEATKCDCPKAD